MRDKGEYLVKLEKTIQMLYDWLSVLREEREQRRFERKNGGVEPESVQIQGAGDVEENGSDDRNGYVPDLRKKKWRRAGIFGISESASGLGERTGLDGNDRGLGQAQPLVSNE